MALFFPTTRANFLKNHTFAVENIKIASRNGYVGAQKKAQCLNFASPLPPKKVEHMLFYYAALKSYFLVFSLTFFPSLCSYTEVDETVSWVRNTRTCVDVTNLDSVIHLRADVVSCLPDPARLGQQKYWPVTSVSQTALFITSGLNIHFGPSIHQVLLLPIMRP